MQWRRNALSLALVLGMGGPVVADDADEQRQQLPPLVAIKPPPASFGMTDPYWYSSNIVILATDGAETCDTQVGTKLNLATCAAVTGTYGTFAPRSDGELYPDTEQVRQDFHAIVRAGLSVVRTYTAAPPDVLEVAAEHGLKLLEHAPRLGAMAGGADTQVVIGSRYL